MLVAGGLAAAGAPVAAAHTGELKTVVSAGPYRVVVRALPVAGDEGAALAFRSTITDRRTGAPINAARVRVLVSDRSGVVRGPYRIAGVAGAYSLLVPIPNPSRWRSLRFSIQVAGPLGTASGLYIPPNLFERWLFEPWLLLLAGLAAVLFLHGFVRLRRRGRRDHATWGRLVLFSIGLSLTVLPLVSPIDVVGDHFLLSAHMLQHVLIGDAAPAFLLVALRGPLLFFAVPPPLLRVFARKASLRHVAGWPQRPKVALTIWALAYGGWHVPAAYDYATRNQAVHDLEHASFVVAGLLVWSLLVDPARRGRLSRGRRLGVAAALFLMGTAIADVLIFSFRPLYPAYAQQVERVLSLSPVRDQQLAGLVMTVDQMLTLGICAAVLLWPTLRRQPPKTVALTRQELPA